MNGYLVTAGGVLVNDNNFSKTRALFQMFLFAFAIIITIYYQTRFPAVILSRRAKLLYGRLAGNLIDPKSLSSFGDTQIEKIKVETH